MPEENSHPSTNGVDPVENGVNGGDVEMDEADNTRKGKEDDGDQEMTVVVPPSKSGLTSDDTKPGDDDTEKMEIDSGKKDTDEKDESKEDDPVAKTIAGMFALFSPQVRAPRRSARHAGKGSLDCK